VVLEYLGELPKAQESYRRSRMKFKKRTFTNDFAEIRSLHPGSIYRLVKKYKEGGEDALIPEYGKNKGKTIIKTCLSHLIDPLIIPSRTAKEIVCEFIKACEAAGEKAPCKETIQKYIKEKREAEERPYAPPKIKSIAELQEEVLRLREEVIYLRSQLKIQKDGGNISPPKSE